jgi:molecular chaperone GrpE
VADDKGKFSTNISQEAIEAALAAVKRRSSPEGATTPDAEGIPVEVEQDGSGQVEALTKEIEQLKAQLEFSQSKGRETLEKLKEEHDRLLRAAADLDNQKKRAQREKEESLKFGLEKFLKELLPVADNMDRALGHAETSSKESLIQGVKMTSKLLDDVLGRHGIKSFSAAGQVFDPRVHEAMQQVETDGPSNMVVEEFLRGYTLNERMVRPALVSVSSQKKATPAQPASSGASSQSPEPSNPDDASQKEQADGRPKEG